MDYLKYAEKLKTIEYYIQNNMAVTVDSLSDRLGVSRRTVLRMVDTLKEQGKEIKYCKKRRQYLIEE
jgi:predicted DNA-binding transcriptional regulator YafY